MAHRHVIGVDHADQLGALPRLAHHVQAEQSTQSIHRRAGGGSWTGDGGLHQIRLGRIWALLINRRTHHLPVRAPIESHRSAVSGCRPLQ